MLSYSTHVFSEILLHFNWHCKGDRPLILPEWEEELYSLIREYCEKSRGVIFLGIGGASDHVHLVIQIEPLADIAGLAGKIKGASSHGINKRHGPGSLEWQRGYGVVSFAKRDLPGVLKYVGRQKEHHAQGTVRPILENCGNDSDPDDNADANANATKS